MGFADTDGWLFPDLALKESLSFRLLQSMLRRPPSEGRPLPGGWSRVHTWVSSGDELPGTHAGAGPAVGTCGETGSGAWAWPVL